MSDLLVKLYDLPGVGAVEGYSVRRPLAHERDRVAEWVGQHFTTGWQSEVACAFGEPPTRGWIAIDETTRAIAGFAVYDVVFRGFFGPIGVAESARGRGLGTALTLRALHSMREAGYAYAVIGGASSVSYYAEAVGAVEIEGSSPGAYPIA